MSDHPSKPDRGLRLCKPEGWPELIDAVALGEIIDRSTRTAQRHIASQLFGPPIQLGATQYIRRNDLLRGLELLRVPAVPGAQRRRQ